MSAARSACDDQGERALEDRLERRQVQTVRRERTNLVRLECRPPQSVGARIVEQLAEAEKQLAAGLDRRRSAVHQIHEDAGGRLAYHVRARAFERFDERRLAADEAAAGQNDNLRDAILARRRPHCRFGIQRIPYADRRGDAAIAFGARVVGLVNGVHFDDAERCGRVDEAGRHPLALGVDLRCAPAGIATVVPTAAIVPSTIRTVPFSIGGAGDGIDLAADDGDRLGAR